MLRVETGAPVRGDPSDAHRVSPHAARRPRPQRRLSRGAATRHRHGRDHGCRHRRRHRLPRLPGGQARRQARRSLRGGRDRRCRAQAPAPQPPRQLPASPRCTRPRWPTPERVDVVVCETLGNYPFEENIIATLNDARARFLKPGGVIIPHSVEQFVCARRRRALLSRARRAGTRSATASTSRRPRP